MLLLLLACVNPAKESGEDSKKETDAAGKDVLRTDLSLDLAKLRGSATIDVVSASNKLNLNVGDLSISSVRLNGEKVDYTVEGDRMTVETGDGEQQLQVEYGFSAKKNNGFDGWMPGRGITFLWPYFCGNLFPCDPDTNDGLQFSLNVTGVEEGLTSIYPKEISADAPPYMLGIAVGNYKESELGTTSSGTRVSAWAPPSGTEDVLAGTKNLVDAFDFLERTYGPYTFGDHVGSVVVPWGDWGGMEHHPFWHVGDSSIRSEEAHVHEGAHGWYGDGVRIACWEDLTLAEGTTTYITGRALDSVGGPDLFVTYIAELDNICNPAKGINTIAMPGTCGEIDILTDPLWSMVPYMKGACFYEDLSHTMGTAALDEVIARFYQDHVGGSATMQDMLDAIRPTLSKEQQGVFDGLVVDWLTGLDCPKDYAKRCSLR